MPLYHITYNMEQSAKKKRHQVASRFATEYKQQHEMRRKAGDEILAKLRTYLEKGGYDVGKMSTMQFRQLGRMLGIVELLPGPHGGPVPVGQRFGRNAVMYSSSEDASLVAMLKGVPADKRDVLLKLVEQLKQ
jgi:hypothetical protein